jgi:hypothetical protein
VAAMNEENTNKPMKNNFDKKMPDVPELTLPAMKVDISRLLKCGLF